MNEECLICKAPLEYLDADEWMECELCHKKQSSKTGWIGGGKYIQEPLSSLSMKSDIPLWIENRRNSSSK